MSVQQEAERTLAGNGLATEWQAFASDVVQFDPRGLLAPPLQGTVESTEPAHG